MYMTINYKECLRPFFISVVAAKIHLGVTVIPGLQIYHEVFILHDSHHV